MADLDQAIRLNPEYGEAYHLRARVHESQQAHDKAIGDYAAGHSTPATKRAEAYQSRGVHLLFAEAVRSSDRRL